MSIGSEIARRRKERGKPPIKDTTRFQRMMKAEVETRDRNVAINRILNIEKKVDEILKIFQKAFLRIL